jgi:cobyric acid synthase
MLQGTGSHVGKTVLVAGLCRLLARRGLRVRPFKSQNMSLDAHVAANGGEMGWAQVMQAEAAGAPARVEMNPILLKPRAEARSQAVLLGRVLREADAVGYCGYQMLGRAIADPHHVESGGDEAGLGLLPVVTTLGREKITRRVRAGWRPDGPGFEGYEIHAGVTAGDGSARPLLDVEGHPRDRPPPTGASGARICMGSSSPARPGGTCWTGLDPQLPSGPGVS